MKREIKFRAWDSRKNIMLHGNNGLFMFLCSGVIGWQYANDFLIEHSYTKQDKYILMQFTGLKGENGKEIYEGDIIISRCSVGRKPEIVEYNPPLFSLHGKNGNDDYWSPLQEKAEIIGNIYENPELLK